MQTNKQNKIVWQQLQITATDFRKDLKKNFFFAYSFLLFYFDLQLK